MSPLGPLRLIVNRRAGAGAVARRLPRLVGELRRAGLEFDVVETTGPGHATVAARQALAEGVRLLVAVGGDGTCHEVANGMFDLPEPEAVAAGAAPLPVAPDAVLGVVAAGSGSDFVRTFDQGGGGRRGSLAPHLAGAATRRIDVGVLACTGLDGRPTARVFVNIAEVGYGAEVVRHAARYPGRLGRFRYLLGAYGALRSLRREDALVRVGGEERTVPLVALVAANCRYYGGGMQVAPAARPDDGTLTIQVFTGRRSQVLLLTPKLYRGAHVPHPDILEHEAPAVAVEPSAPLPVEADGELLGTAPVTVRVVPAALLLKV